MGIQVVAIIGLLAAIGGIVYQVAGGSDAGQHGALIHLQCRSCGETWTMPANEIAGIRGTAGNPNKKMTCPKCHKEAGEEMALCRKCGKYYLPKTDGSDTYLKCPNCGFDPIAGQ